MKNDSVHLTDKYLVDLRLPQASELDKKFGALSIGYPNLLVQTDAIVQIPIGYDDEFASKISVLMHFEGEQNSTSFFDEVSKTTAPFEGTPKLVIPAVRPPFGTSAVQIPGYPSKINPAATQNFNISSTNFTIECWVYLTNLANTRTVYSDWVGGVASACSLACRIEPNGSLSVSYGIGSTNAGISTSASNPVKAATWTHVAFERYGNTINIYKDGKLLGSSTLIGNLNPLLVPTIGSFRNARFGEAEYTFNGLMKEFCITKEARYKGLDFTPRRTPYYVGNSN